MVPVGEAAENKSRGTVSFGSKVWEAVLRVAAMALFLVLHECLDLLCKRLIPSPLFAWLHAASIALFSIIYLHLLFDAVRVFVGEDVDDLRRWWLTRKRVGKEG